MVNEFVTVIFDFNEASTFIKADNVVVVVGGVGAMRAESSFCVYVAGPVSVWDFKYGEGAVVAGDVVLWSIGDVFVVGWFEESGVVMWVIGVIWLDW